MRRVVRYQDNFCPDHVVFVSFYDSYITSDHMVLDFVCFIVLLMELFILDNDDY